MKNKTILFLSIVVAVAFGFFLLRSGEKPKPPLGAEVSDTNSPATDGTLRQNVAVTQTNSTGDVAAPKESKYEPTTEAEANAKIRTMLETRNQPVELWGKVVDQDGTPLSGVKVESEINRFVWPPEQYPNGISTKQGMVTDVDGQFHVRDDSATGVHVTLQKDGYEQESRNGYGSKTGGGSQNNPVILKMWSANIHEKLITEEKKFQIVPDGRPYFINIIEGTISESGEGNLKVWVKRPDKIAYGKQYNWSCGIDVINGGLLAEDDAGSSIYLAPADGYTSTFQFEQQIGSGWGDTTGSKRFFIRLNNGQEYGRIAVELMAYYNDQIPGMIRIGYAINPSGSRILR